jgi:hypothetical protein
MFSIFGQKSAQKPLRNMKTGMPQAKFVGTEIWFFLRVALANHLEGMA